MSNVFVKPARTSDGVVLLVRDPESGKPLGEHGEWKTRSQFWTRRLRDGDVIEGAPDGAAVLVAGSVEFVRCAGCIDPSCVDRCAR